MVYKTIRSARNQAALDAGFDRWNYRRITIAELREAGYIVDPVAWRRQREKKQNESNLGAAVPTYNYECDNGHSWTATDQEDQAACHRCPRCGEYWQ